MGLDMYLYKKIYVENKYRDKDKQVRVVVPKNQKGVVFPIKIGSIKIERISEIIEEVACWRKANAIHKWFVENVQDEEDDCGDYYVPLEKLEELLITVKDVLASIKLIDGEQGKVVEDTRLARELLPAQSGFFFGSTDYDEWYVRDLEYTADVLKDLLSNEPDGEYYYRSSW